MSRARPATVTPRLRNGDRHRGRAAREAERPAVGYSCRQKGFARDLHRPLDGVHADRAGQLFAHGAAHDDRRPRHVRANMLGPARRYRVGRARRRGGPGLESGAIGDGDTTSAACASAAGTRVLSSSAASVGGGGAQSSPAQTPPARRPTAARSVPRPAAMDDQSSPNSSGSSRRCRSRRASSAATSSAPGQARTPPTPPRPGGAARARRRSEREPLPGGASSSTTVLTLRVRGIFRICDGRRSSCSTAPPFAPSRVSSKTEIW